jgi:hypothetical protein
MSVATIQWLQPEIQTAKSGKGKFGEGTKTSFMTAFYISK